MHLARGFVEDTKCMAHNHTILSVSLSCDGTPAVADNVHTTTICSESLEAMITRANEADGEHLQLGD